MSKIKDVSTKAAKTRLKEALQNTLSDVLKTHQCTTKFQHSEGNELVVLYAMLFDREIRNRIYAMPQINSGQNFPRVLYELLSYLLTEISSLEIFDWRYVYIFDTNRSYTQDSGSKHNNLFHYLTNNFGSNTQLFGNEISRSNKLLILAMLRDLQPLLTNSKNLLEETISLISENLPLLSSKIRQHPLLLKEILFFTLLETPAIAYLCYFLSVHSFSLCRELAVPLHLSPFFVESLKTAILRRISTTNSGARRRLKRQGNMVTISQVSRENKSYLLAANKVKLKVTLLKQKSLANFLMTQKSKIPFLNFGSFLQHNSINHVIGRSQEVQKIFRILLRVQRSNPILIGEKGIGKFALLNELLLSLQRTSEKPMTLLLDLDKIQRNVRRFVIQLVKVRDRPLLVVITDVSVLVSSEVIAAALRVGLLTRPVRLIGLTTSSEYKRSFEKIKDWLTFIQSIYVIELSPKNVLEVVRTKKITYERYYQVELPDKLLHTLITFSKHLSTSVLPQKAFDILDEACSEFKLRSYKKSRKFETLNLSFTLLETYKYNRRLAISEFEKINYYLVQSIFQWGNPIQLNVEKVFTRKSSCSLERMMRKGLCTSWQSYRSNFQSRVRSLFFKLRRQRYFLDWYKNKWQFTTYISEYRNRRLTKSYFHFYFMSIPNRQKKNVVLRNYQPLKENLGQELLMKELMACKQRICQYRLVEMINLVQRDFICILRRNRIISLNRLSTVGFLYSLFGNDGLTRGKTIKSYLLSFARLKETMTTVELQSFLSRIPKDKNKEIWLMWEGKYFWNTNYYQKYWPALQRENVLAAIYRTFPQVWLRTRSLISKQMKVIEQIQLPLISFHFYLIQIITLSEYFTSTELLDKVLTQELERITRNTYRYAWWARYLPIVAETLSTSVPSLYRNQRLITPANTNLLTEDFLIETISKLSGKNLVKLSKFETDKLLNLEGRLQKKVIGQYEAIEAVAKSLRRASVGLKDSRRPIASFVFAGPSGTGKTELTKTLAEIYFGSEKSLIRFDMSEYMESHAVSKLIGSPPGYVGYDQGGLLTDRVKKNPFSLVLFDELEKAHPDIFNILLQVLDDGRLTDSQGTVVDFSNTLIIMTSNIGARRILDESSASRTDEEPEPKPSLLKNKQDLSRVKLPKTLITSLQVALTRLRFFQFCKYYMFMAKNTNIRRDHLRYRLLAKYCFTYGYNYPALTSKNISRVFHAYDTELLFFKAIKNRGFELDLSCDSFNEEVWEQQTVNKLYEFSTSYERMKDVVSNQLGEIFRPELLNRLDETIVFRKLTKRETRKITEIFLKNVAKRLRKSKNIELIFTKRLKSFLLDVGHDPKYGARPMRRAITRYVEDLLAEKLLEQITLPNTIISVDIILMNNKDQSPKKAYKKSMILITVLEPKFS